MQITNKQLVAAVAGINLLVKAKGLKGRGAFRFSRIVSEAHPLLAAFNNARDTLVREHALKGPDGELRTEEDGEKVLFHSEERFQKDMDDLLAEVITIQVEPMRISDLEGVRLSPVEEGGEVPEEWELYRHLGVFCESEEESV